jgi:hypothetical protein
MKLVSRAAWSARAYRKPNGATEYAGPRRGVKIHYLGTFYADRPHPQCPAYVRQIQSSHMDDKGWSDIGYSFVVCTHGAVYEGRGLDRRNSANGNTALNEENYAVCALLGSSGLTKPPAAQLHGLRDAIEYCRREGPAGTWLGGHKDGYSTDCPGGPLYTWVRGGALRPGVQRTVVDLSRLVAAAQTDPSKRGTPVSYPGTKTVEDALVAEGLLARSLADGHFGTGTRAAYALWQQRCGFTGAAADGVPGMESLKRLAAKHGFGVTA